MQRLILYVNDLIFYAAVRSLDNNFEKPFLRDGKVRVSVVVHAMVVIILKVINILEEAIKACYEHCEEDKKVKHT